MRLSLAITRLILALGGVAATTPAVRSPGFGQRPAPWITYDVPNQFSNPVGLARPTFRYWVPDADVDNDVIVSDLRQMKENGWGGVEIICLENYGIELAVVDPAIYGYGGKNWYDKFALMLNTARELGLSVDFALGPTQGASIPILDPDTPGMNTELAYGTADLASGQSFNGTLPPPIKVNPGYANAPDFSAPFTNFTNKFVAAVVARKSKSRYPSLPVNVLSRNPS